MFSLGYKEAIVNNASKFPLVINGTKMNIKGFGTFQQEQLRSCVAQRYIASRLDALSFDAPSATALGIASGTNVPVTFNFVIKSTRLSSEYANNYIINGRPIVIEILVTAGETSAQVAVKLQAAFTEWAAKFNYADQGLPFTVSADANITSYLTLTLNQYFLYFQKTITCKVNNTIAPILITGDNYKLVDDNVTVTAAVITNITSTVGLMVGDTVAFVAAGFVPGHASASLATTTIASIDSATQITVTSGTGAVTTDKLYLVQKGMNPTFDGKYLEENARMSLETTSDSYSISPDEKPMISGKYTTITFTADDATYGGIGAASGTGFAKHAFLGSTRGEIGGTRQFKFTLYVLEGSDAFTDSGWLEQLLNFIDGASGFAPTLKTGTNTTAANVEAFRAAAIV
jgi:hypothetical protein